MIRINLLGQARPRRFGARQAVPLGAVGQLLLVVVLVAVAGGFLAFDYARMGRELERTNQEIHRRQSDLARLDRLKQEVTAYEQQKAALDQRLGVIRQLQQERTGARELLEAVANTVNRSETLWLTSLSRQGSSLTIEGTAGSINAVANFIAQLRRSGYFDKVEIKEARQDEVNQEAATFLFTLEAEYKASREPPGASAAAKKG